MFSRIFLITLFQVIHVVVSSNAKINFREKEKEVLDQILGPGRYDARIRPSGVNGTERISQNGERIQYNLYTDRFKEIDKYFEDKVTENIYDKTEASLDDQTISTSSRSSNTDDTIEFSTAISETNEKRLLLLNTDENDDDTEDGDTIEFSTATSQTNTEEFLSTKINSHERVLEEISTERKETINDMFEFDENSKSSEEERESEEKESEEQKPEEKEWEEKDSEGKESEEREVEAITEKISSTNADIASNLVKLDDKHLPKEASNENAELSEEVNNLVSEDNKSILNLVKLDEENVYEKSVNENLSELVQNNNKSKANLVKIAEEEVITEENQDTADENKSTIVTSFTYGPTFSNRFGINQNLETTTYPDVTSTTASNSDTTTSEEASDKIETEISSMASTIDNFDEITTRLTVTSTTNSVYDSFAVSSERNLVGTSSALNEVDKDITIGGRININPESDSASTTNTLNDLVETTSSSTSTTNYNAITTVNDATEAYKNVVTIGGTGNELYKSNKDDYKTTTKSSITIINEPTEVIDSARYGSSRSFDLNGKNQYDIFTGIKTTTPSDFITTRPKTTLVEETLGQGLLGTTPTTTTIQLFNRVGIDETTSIENAKVSLAADILPPKLDFDSSSETSTDDGLVKAVFTGEIILDNPVTDLAPRKGFFFNFQNLGAYNLASITRGSFERTTTPVAVVKPKPPQRKNGVSMPEFSLGIINKYTGSDLHIDTINLGKTGSINRLGESKPMLFNGFQIYQPTYGKFL